MGMSRTLSLHGLQDRIRQRVRADFRVAVYLVFGALAVAVLLPIAGVRYAQGRVDLALLEAVIIVGILLAVRSAWRGHDLDRLGVAMTLTITTGGCAVAALSPVGLYWLFPILMAGAFLAPFWWALPAFAGTVAFLLWHGDALAHSGQPLAVLAAMGVNCAFAAVFARHAGNRRAQLEVLARRDPLTGAGNRRALDDALAAAVDDSDGTRPPATLLLLDLDHFKAINDRHGHEVGDRVLREFVLRVQRSVRATDRLFRFGGEEFVLLLDHADERAVERVFLQIRARLAEHGGLAGMPVTVSGGAAQRFPDESVERWLARADAALYAAKQQGRDRLVLAPPAG
jgi:diguanylate cyclase (GGDEF)-like protein